MNIVVSKGIFKEIATETYKVMQLRKALEKREKELMDKLKVITLGNAFEFGEFNFKKIDRPGSVDYSLIPELKNINLDNYRKQPATYFMLEKKDIELEETIKKMISECSEDSSREPSNKRTLNDIVKEQEEMEKLVRAKIVNK